MSYTQRVEKQEYEINRKPEQLKRKISICKRLTRYRTVLFPPFRVLTRVGWKKYSNELKNEETGYSKISDELKPFGEGHGDYSDPQNIEHRNGLYYGMDEYGLPIHLSHKDKTTHSIVIGRTGSGKTTKVLHLMRQTRVQGGSFIFVDGKSDNDIWTKRYYLMKERNREDELFLLSFRGSLKSSSNSWNILSVGTSIQMGELIGELKGGDGGGDNQVFEDRGMQRVVGTLSRFTYFRDILKQDVNVGDLNDMMKRYRLLRMLKKTKEDRENDPRTEKYRKFWIPEDYIEPGQQQPRKKLLRDFARDLGVIGYGELPETSQDLFDKQHRFRVMTFAKRISMMANEYGHIFNVRNSDINFSELIKNNKCLYVLLPRLEKSESSSNRLGKVVMRGIKNRISQTLGGMTEGKQDIMTFETVKKRPIPRGFIMCDEYGAYQSKGMSTVLRQRRSLNIGVQILIQEIRSLKNEGDVEFNRLMGNRTSKSFLKIEDIDTIEYRSRRRGKIQMAVDNNVGKMEKDKDSDSYSIQEVDMISENFIKKFKNGQGFFMTEDERRYYQTGYYEPKIGEEIALSNLYPTC